MESEQREHIENDVLAVMRSGSDVDELVSDLRNEGFEPEGIRVLRPHEGSERLDPFGHTSGIVTKIVKHLQGHLSDENRLLEEYEEASKSGLEIIAIHVEEPAQVETAREVLQAHNAQNIRHFGTFAVTDLEDQGRATT